MIVLQNKERTFQPDRLGVLSGKLYTVSTSIFIKASDLPVLEKNFEKRVNDFTDRLTTEDRSVVVGTPGVRPTHESGLDPEKRTFLLGYELSLVARDLAKGAKVLGDFADLLEQSIKNGQKAEDLGGARQ